MQESATCLQVSVMLLLPMQLRYLPTVHARAVPLLRPAIFNRCAAKGPQVCRGSLWVGRKEARKKMRNKEVTLQCNFTSPPFALVKPPVPVFSQLFFGSGVLIRVSLH
jgi:hypothetical protein